MKLTIPSNWDNGLITRVDKSKIEVIYGKLSSDYIGGGRASCILDSVSRHNAKLHIEKIHKNGLKFHYVLNASCLGNREWTRNGQLRIKSLLDWLFRIKVDGVIVASPYLFQYVRTNYPDFEVAVSCFANVNSVKKAKFWDDLRASTITLSHFEILRDFQTLEKIRKNVKCKLQLLVNDNCMQNCPLCFYHNNVVSHASQITASLGSYIFDYCRLFCRYLTLLDTTNFLKATWIRPEDLHFYSDIGIDSFKLVDRALDTDAIVKNVKAYSDGRYDGNLYDLFASSSKSLWRKKKRFFHLWKYFFHPFAVNLLKVIKKRKILDGIDIKIDNAKLDGFIDYFLKNNCRQEGCETCSHCRDFAEKAVIIDSDYRLKTAGEYKDFLKEINTGEIFKY